MPYDIATCLRQAQSCTLTKTTLDIFKRTTYLATLFWLPPTAKDIPNIKLIQFFSAGTNHVAKHPIYTDSKIPLCSANGVHGPQIAEWVIMMDLVHSHNLPRLYDLQKEKRWNQKEGMEVSDRVGKRVGILGYGSIGRQGESNIPYFTSQFSPWKTTINILETPAAYLQYHTGSASSSWIDG